MPRRNRRHEQQDERDFEFEISHRPSFDEVASIAVRQRIEELGSLERRVVSWIYGVGCKPMAADEVAERMNLSVDQVWDMVDEGVHQLGYRVITELAA